jgi:hypothetical protein
MVYTNSLYSNTFAPSDSFSNSHVPFSKSDDISSSIAFFHKSASVPLPTQTRAIGTFCFSQETWQTLLAIFSSLELDYIEGQRVQAMFCLAVLWAHNLSECAVNSAALSYYAVILCTALMQHIASHAR